VWSLVATLAAAVLGGGASSMLLGQGIVGRVRRLTANVDRFVRGEPIVPSRRSYDEIGRLTTHLGNVGDELERRQAALGASRDEALHATQAKDEFLSHMSHELRTPLTAILGFGEILQAEELDEDNRECVDHIVKAGHHLLALINEILDIAKLESGHLTVSLEPVYLAGVVDESLALMQHQAVRSAITVAARVDRDLAVVADQQRLKQVLLNLVSNAVKYNRDGGRVDLAARQAGDRARITVTDTGAGIPPDGLEKLFRPFERLDAAKTGIEGSGVGLALTKGLVEAMQGEIGVDSEVGVGSTFWVELTLATAPPDEVAGLPRRDDQATTGRAGAPELEPVPAPEHGTPEPTPAGTVADAAASPEGPTVLYIEDNPANVRLLESVFQDRPERLEVAVEGQLGIQLARQLEPCLVLLDLHLPDLGGDEVLRALRADPLTADIPVVVISADATPERADQMAADGVTAFLSKPIDAIRLLELVDRLTAVHPG
jgi:signal transduction histidine kinase/CheY-like chemotaxis protein